LTKAIQFVVAQIICEDEYDIRPMPAALTGIGQQTKPE